MYFFTSLYALLLICAKRSFMSAGSLTLGGNMSIALGPLGRNGEALGSLNTSGKVAAMYSYSKTRGLFGGVSVEGSVIVERQDANALAYQSDVTVRQLLSGAIDPPDWAQPLIKTLEACVGIPGGHKWVDDSADISSLSRSNTGGSGYMFGGVASPGSEMPPNSRRKKGESISSFPPPHWGRKKSSGSYFHTESNNDLTSDNFNSQSFDQRDTRESPRSPTVGSLVDDGSAPTSFATHFDSDYVPPSPNANNFSSRPSHRTTLSVRSSPHSSTYDPASPFNDLPPFPKINKNLNSLSHNRSMSNASYLNQGRSNGSTRQSGNPFASAYKPQTADPFSHQDEFEEDYEEGRIRLTSSPEDKPRLTPKAGLNRPLDPHEGVGRAIALYDFNAVEVRSDVFISPEKNIEFCDYYFLLSSVILRLRKDR